MCARIPVVFAALCLLLVAGATNAGAASSAADRTQDGTLAQAPSERAAAVSGVAPVMVQPAPMSLPGGTTADQVLHATDGDGDPITFSKSFGPAYMTVTTVDPDSGSATGNVHLAPSLADQGVVNGGIVASDGTFVTAATLEITVTGPDRPPVLAQPSPMRGGRARPSTRWFRRAIRMRILSPFPSYRVLRSCRSRRSQQRKASFVCPRRHRTLARAPGR